MTTRHRYGIAVVVVVVVEVVTKNVIVDVGYQAKPPRSRGLAEALPSDALSIFVLSRQISVPDRVCTSLRCNAVLLRFRWRDALQSTR